MLHKPMHSQCRKPRHTGEGNLSHTRTTIAACLEWPVPFHCSHSYSEPTIWHPWQNQTQLLSTQHGLVAACPADQREHRSQAHSRGQKGQDSHSPSAPTVLVPHLFAEVSTAARGHQLDQKPQACHSTPLTCLIQNKHHGPLPQAGCLLSPGYFLPRLQGRKAKCPPCSLPGSYSLPPLSSPCHFCITDLRRKAEQGAGGGG